MSRHCVYDYKERLAYTRRRTRIIALFFALLVVVMLSLELNAGFIAEAYNSDLNFDKILVMDDLQSSTLNGKKFSVSDYPANSFGEVKMISFIEYCYTYRLNAQSNFGLYIYIYNPKNINFDTGSRLNFLQIGIGEGDTVSYEKYSLKFMSKSDGNLKNRFYKFKVIDRKDANGKSLLDKVNIDPYKRIYNVSGVELITYGESLAHDYSVAGKFIYSGFAKGYGTDLSRDTLECGVKDLRTLNLDVKHTYFRPGVVSAEGKNHQGNLDSVYFSVPNNILTEYGDLQKIKATWYEYRTSPIVVTRELDTYKYILENAIGRIVKNNKGDTHSLDKDITIAFSSCDGEWSYNNRAYEVNTLKLLSYIFHRGYSNIPYELSGSELLDWIRNYDSSFVNGKILGKYSADLFESGLSTDRMAIPYVGDDIHHKLVEVDAQDKYNLLSHDKTHKWWQKFLDFGFFSPKTGINFENISAIQQVNADVIKSNDKSLISKTLFINENDVNDFKDYYKAASKNNCTPFLFRFAATDYFATDLFTYTGDFWHDIKYPDGKDTAYVAQENVFLNFDIISLTFNKDGKYMVIPVVSDPIDIINDITPPLLPDGWPDWLKLLLKILAIIIILLLLSIVLPVLMPLIAWVITLPFKVLASFFQGVERTVSSAKKKRGKKLDLNKYAAGSGKYKKKSIHRRQ